MPSPFDPFFAVPPRSPFPYGTSPWQTRGSAYLTDMELCARLVPGGVEEALRVADDPELTTFMRQPFSRMGWYDDMPAQYFGRASARACGITHNVWIRKASIVHAEAARRGLVGVMLRLLSAEAVALWIPRFGASITNYGTIETRVVSPGVVRGACAGLPRVLVGTWSLFATYFMEELLGLHGAKHVRVHALGAEQEPPGGAAYETYRVTYEVGWG